jgi:hypothetical protein
MTDFSQMSNEQLYALANQGTTDMTDINASGGEGSQSTPNWALYAEAEGELRKRLGMPPMQGHNIGSNISGLWKAYQAQPTWFKLALAGTTAGAVGAFGGAGGGGAGAGAGVGESVSGAYPATAAELGTAGGTAAGGTGLASQAGYGVDAADVSAGQSLDIASKADIAAGGGTAPLPASLAGGAGAGAGAGTGAGTAAGTAATGTALSRILNGSGTPADYLSVTGQVAPALISAYGSNEQRKSQEQLAAEYRAMGAPYRDRLAGLYADPSGFLTSPEVTIPVQQGTDSLARALSVKGNPAGSGTALQEIQNYSANQLFGRLGQEKDRLAGFGGLSYYNQAAPMASQQAINAQGTVYGDIGYGVGNVMNPQQQSLAQLLRQYQRGY